MTPAVVTRPPRASATLTRVLGHAPPRRTVFDLLRRGPGTRALTGRRPGRLAHAFVAVRPRRPRSAAACDIDDNRRIGFGVGVTGGNDRPPAPRSGRDPQPGLGRRHGVEGAKRLPLSVRLPIDFAGQS